MATRSYILEVEGLQEQKNFDLARNALFRETLIFDLRLSPNKKRLTVKIEEETLMNVVNILEGFGHPTKLIKPSPGGIEGIFI